MLPLSIVRSCSWFGLKKTGAQLGKKNTKKQKKKNNDIPSGAAPFPRAFLADGGSAAAPGGVVVGASSSLSASDSLDSLALASCDSSKSSDASTHAHVIAGRATARCADASRHAALASTSSGVTSSKPAATRSSQSAFTEGQGSLAAPKRLEAAEKVSATVENAVCRLARYRNGPFRTHANGFYGRGKTLSKENQKAIINNKRYTATDLFRRSKDKPRQK